MGAPLPGFRYSSHNALYASETPMTIFVATGPTVTIHQAQLGRAQPAGRHGGELADVVQSRVCSVRCAEAREASATPGPSPSDVLAATPRPNLMYAYVHKHAEKSVSDEQLDHLNLGAVGSPESQTEKQRKHEITP